MTYEEFLDHIIEDGIQAVRDDKHYTGKRERGAIDGFEMCRGKSISGLRKAYAIVSYETESAYHLSTENRIEIDDYWYFRIKASEVEWVCNCVGYVLIMNGKDPICPVTTRGATKAILVMKTHGSPELPMVRV